MTRVLIKKSIWISLHRKEIMWCGVRDLPSKEHWRFTYRLSGASGEEQNILFSEVRGKSRSAEILILELRCSDHETSTFLLFKSQTKPRFSLTAPFVLFLNLLPLPLPCVSKCAGDKISSNKKNNLELLVLLPPSPKCWHYRHNATMPGSCSPPLHHISCFKPSLALTALI